MHQAIYNLDEIRTRYLAFLQKKDCPKIENLTNWGCHRLFLAENFQIKDCALSPARILIEFNARTYQLDTTQAPKFLDQQLYLSWLYQQLLK